MSITTRAGDRGKTSLLNGQRVSKASLRLEAFGTVDELNAVISVVLAEESVPDAVRKNLIETQRLLFLVGTDLATPMEALAKIQRVSGGDINSIGSWINELEQSLHELKHFILPGGSRLAALLHQARTVCRRAERCVVRLSEKEEIDDQIQIYLNRLSDYLFLVAREVNREAGVEDAKIMPAATKGCSGL